MYCSALLCTHPSVVLRVFDRGWDEALALQLIATAPRESSHEIRIPLPVSNRRDWMPRTVQGILSLTAWVSQSDRAI